MTALLETIGHMKAYGISGHAYNLGDIGEKIALINSGNQLDHATEPHAVLLADTPLAIFTNGATLAADGSINLTALENVDGRPLLFNLDMPGLGSYEIIVTVTTSINGGAATLCFDAAGLWLFHHISGGAWTASLLPVGAVATEPFRGSFADTDWAADGTLTIIRSGSPGAGEIGPHGKAISSSYLVQVFSSAGGVSTAVDCPYEIDQATGDVTLYKSPSKLPFDGTVTLM